MKAWRAVAMLAVVSLVGCGGSRELNRAREDADALRAENAALKAKVSALEGQLASVTKERDELKTAAARTSPSPTVEQAYTAPSKVSSIRAVGENAYEIPRAELDKELETLDGLKYGARVIPAFKDGLPVGFKLFSVRSDSVYGQLGIQSGDVIRRVNGVDLTSPDKALELYSKAKDASRFEIELERSGASIRKVCTVR